MKNLIIVFGLFMTFLSCEDYFEPKLTNELPEDQFLSNPNQVRGLLTYAYRAIPSTFNSFEGDFLDAATSNALSNNVTGPINRINEFNGFWTPVTNPINNWQERYDDLKNINQFLELGLDGTIIYYPADLARDARYRERLKGEAYFLRAWIYFDLLRRYGGVDTNGQLMGVPLITSSINIIEDDLSLSRNTYDECVQQIINDLDVALSAGLPDTFSVASETDDFNQINIGRPTNVACKALKSRVLLYAASPAFGSSTYAQAAQAAFDVLDVVGTTLADIYDVNNISNSFYNTDVSTNVYDVDDELIMRNVNGGTAGTRALEEANFPPIHFGNGRCNPSQNLVDAFPMANGYPITDAVSGYSESDMYLNRDPRFYMTVIHNNQVFKGQNIETFEGGNNMPGSERGTIENTTRTGYYLRKWISNSVSLVPGNTANDVHYNALFRKVEMFLNFAEAANEEYGPDGGSFGFTAREAIAEVRRRAGIQGGDTYLTSIASKEDMRELIKNERRIELCFEGHYFFDVRRWDDNLNVPIQGVTITRDQNNNTFDITRRTVVSPSYNNYMIYGPLPFDEILRTENITQNQGW